MGNSETTNSHNFERSLEELETIIHKLEAGDLSLDQSLELFERGVTLSRACRQRLDAAERRIEILLKGSDGTRTPVPFEDSESDLSSEEET